MRALDRPAVLALAYALVTVACATAPDDRERGAAPPPIQAEAPGAEPAATPERAPETPHPAAAPRPDADVPPPAELSLASPPPPVDPLQQIRDEQMQREDRRLVLERARDRMNAAAAAVETLEKRLLAVRNPYLPRPQLPPDETQAWEGLDGAQRAQRVEEQLAAARTELAAARQAFVDAGGRLD